MTTFTTISDQEPFVSSELSQTFETTDAFAHFEYPNNFQTEYYLSFLQTVQEKCMLI